MRGRHGRYLCSDSFFLSNIPDSSELTEPELNEYISSEYEGIFEDDSQLTEIFREAFDRFKLDSGKGFFTYQIAKL
jgi:hypothetical protein